MFEIFKSNVNNVLIPSLLVKGTLTRLLEREDKSVEGVLQLCREGHMDERERGELDQDESKRGLWLSQFPSLF